MGKAAVEEYGILAAGKCFCLAIAVTVNLRNGDYPGKEGLNKG